jgi:hypothetical protein
MFIYRLTFSFAVSPPLRLASMENSVANASFTEAALRLAEIDDCPASVHPHRFLSIMQFFFFVTNNFYF